MGKNYSSFKKENYYGQRAESFVFDLYQHFGINMRFNKTKAIEHSEKVKALRGHDLEVIKPSEKPLKLEIKYDRNTRDTGNLAIEYAHNGNYSGISTTESPCWIYVSSECMYILDIEKLKLFLYNPENSDKWRYMKTDNHYMSNCCLVKHELLSELGICTASLSYERLDDFNMNVTMGEITHKIKLYHTNLYEKFLSQN